VAFNHVQCNHKKRERENEINNTMRIYLNKLRIKNMFLINIPYACHLMDLPSNPSSFCKCIANASHVKSQVTRMNL